MGILFAHVRDEWNNIVVFERAAAWVGWVSEIKIWTDSGSQGRLYKLTFDLTQQNCKPPWDDMWYVRYINTQSFIHSYFRQPPSFKFIQTTLSLLLLLSRWALWALKNAQFVGLEFSYISFWQIFIQDVLIVFLSHGSLRSFVFLLSKSVTQGM